MQRACLSVKLVFHSCLIFLFGCGHGKQPDEYATMVNRADSIVIIDKLHNRTFDLSPPYLDNFKQVLITNIKIEPVRKFRSDIQVDLYRKKCRIAYYMIVYNNNDSFVNFSSDQLHFGFKLTYGIGRFLDEIMVILSQPQKNS